MKTVPDPAVHLLPLLFSLSLLWNALWQMADGSPLKKMQTDNVYVNIHQGKGNFTLRDVLFLQYRSETEMTASCCVFLFTVGSVIFHRKNNTKPL